MNKNYQHGWQKSKNKIICGNCGEKHLPADMEKTYNHINEKMITICQNCSYKFTGLILKRARIERQLSQIECAKLLNITQATMSKIEAGILFPSYEVLKAMRKFLELDINKIMDETKY